MSKRRSVKKDIKRYLSPQEIFELINNSKEWDYKTLKELYVIRDKALISVLYLTGGRISEVLKLVFEQLDFSVPDFIIIKDMEISKRRKGSYKPKLNFPLPLKGDLGKITNFFIGYYNIVKTKEGRIFPISRFRAHAIIKNNTGLWCHYFRSQWLSFRVNKLKSALITAQLMGITNPQTLMHYYKTMWEEHKESYQ